MSKGRLSRNGTAAPQDRLAIIAGAVARGEAKPAELYAWSTLTALAVAIEHGHDCHPFHPFTGAVDAHTACRRCGRGLWVKVRVAGPEFGGAASRDRCEP